jgi:hypothetical protein
MLHIAEHFSLLSGGGFEAQRKCEAKNKYSVNFNIEDISHSIE